MCSILCVCVCVMCMCGVRVCVCASEIYMCVCVCVCVCVLQGERYSDIPRAQYKEQIHKNNNKKKKLQLLNTFPLKSQHVYCGNSLIHIHTKYTGSYIHDQTGHIQHMPRQDMYIKSKQTGVSTGNPVNNHVNGNHSAATLSINAYSLILKKKAILDSKKIDHKS